MSTSRAGNMGDGGGFGVRGGEWYSLEHVEGIRNEGQRANGVSYLYKTDISCQQFLMLRK